MTKHGSWRPWKNISWGRAGACCYTPFRRSSSSRSYGTKKQTNPQSQSIGIWKTNDDIKQLTSGTLQPANGTGPARPMQNKLACKQHQNTQNGAYRSNNPSFRLAAYTRIPSESAYDCEEYGKGRRKPSSNRMSMFGFGTPLTNPAGLCVDSEVIYHEVHHNPEKWGPGAGSSQRGNYVPPANPVYQQAPPPGAPQNPFITVVSVETKNDT
eukprot:8720867-Pyramimonas_sp.AAC.1